MRCAVAKIKQAVTSQSPDMVKQMFEEPIDRVEITPDRHAYPYFYVPDMDRTMYAESAVFKMMQRRMGYAGSVALRAVGAGRAGRFSSGSVLMMD